MRSVLAAALACSLALPAYAAPVQESPSYAAVSGKVLAAPQILGYVGAYGGGGAGGGSVPDPMVGDGWTPAGGTAAITGALTVSSTATFSDDIVGTVVKMRTGTTLTIQDAAGNTVATITDAGTVGYVTANGAELGAVAGSQIAATIGAAEIRRNSTGALVVNGGGGDLYLEESTGNRTIAMKSGAGGAAIRFARATKTEAYTLVHNQDHTVIATGVTTITLPTAVSASGRQFCVKNGNAGGEDVTIARTSSQTIDGADADITLSLFNSSACVESDGAGWHIISSHVAASTL